VATGGNFVAVNHLLSNDGQRPRPTNVYAPIKDDIVIYPGTVRQIYWDSGVMERHYTSFWGLKYFQMRSLAPLIAWI
jgi:hypothetical protein